MSDPVHINCDMGEGFGLFRVGDDHAMMPRIDAANVACGFHAGDPVVMNRTVALAKMHGVQVGAHPSFPDLQGFGRRAMDMGAEELTAAVVYQVGALKAFLDLHGLALSHVKLHGALYAMAARDAEVANAILDAVFVFGVPFYGLPGTLHESACRARGVAFVAEFFVDLEYDDYGHVLITRSHEAVDEDRAAERAWRAVTEGVVVSAGGRDVAVRAETLCIHSDTPNAPLVAAAVRRLAEARGAPSPAAGGTRPPPSSQTPKGNDP